MYYERLKFSTNEGLPQFSRPSTKKPRNEIEATINGLSYHFDFLKKPVAGTLIHL